MKIDKAIQEHDLRTYYALNTEHESTTPLLQTQCQVIDSNLLTRTGILSTAEDTQAQMPIVAILNRPNIVNLPRSEDFTFISRIDCTESGVRESQEHLRVLIRRYYRSFIELNNLRESLATNNDVFGGDLAQIARDTSEGKTQRVHLIYYNIKQKIEAGIAQFVTEISQLGSEMRRYQQIVIGRRMGWGYLLNNPNSNFVMVVRHLPLLYGGLMGENLLRIPDGWKTLNKRSENAATESSQISIVNAPIINDCVKDVTTLKQFSNLMSSGGNKTFEIFALKEEQELLLIKLNNLKTIFKIWFKTSRGWFYRDYWRSKFQSVKNDFGVLFRTILKSSSDMEIKIKIVKDVSDLIEKQLDLNLAWYYDPTENLKIVAEFLWNQYELIRHSSSFQLKDDDESKGDNW
jgi:hypothetical protein